LPLIGGRSYVLASRTPQSASESTVSKLMESFLFAWETER
jgi:hypothetical protein